MGDFHDQPQVGFDHRGPRLGVAALDLCSELDFFLRGQQGSLADLAEVEERDEDARVGALGRQLVVAEHDDVVEAADLDGVEDLFDNLRVKRRVAMQRNHHPASALCLDPMTALGPQPNEAGFQQHRFGIRRS